MEVAIILKKICDVINMIILLVLVISAAALFLPNLFGFKAYAVLSGSMEPKYHVGGLVYAKPVNSFDDVKIGDAITFKLSGQESKIATHRVVSIDKDAKEFTTKGDANDVQDISPVPFSNLVGKASKISVPLLGYLSLFIKTKKGILSAISLVFIIIILLFLPDLFNKKPVAQVDETKT